ncbi:hypothetical protein [Myxococcus sp. CA018]|uniref:hypothetical protein n=1 Tax=Myxococcus sp. CA018 TaxID=2651864 RepID=UPI0011446AED|nr:hypothetical protein [Myxococcus sp. CA018]NOK00706.1 hypothetical protein [Myxococcus xanthus]
MGAHDGQRRVEPEKGTTSAAPTSNATGAQKEVQSAKARLDDYNRCHPHRGLKMMSPREFRTANFQA